MSSPAAPDLYVVEVDSRANGTTAAWDNFKESRCNADFFRTKIVGHAKMVCVESKVAKLCGMNLKLYFTKHKPGLDGYYRSGGAMGVQNYIMSQPSLMSSNNGAATYLLTEPDTGLSPYIVTGKVYAVQDDGTSPLSKNQIWGLTEMVNCAMDVYDMDPQQMKKGKKTIERWGNQYQERTFQMPTGTGGVDIYSSRK